MTKKELIEQTMKATGGVGIKHIPVADVEAVINALPIVAAQQLARGHDFTLPGIAKFKVAETAARTGRNPRTGEAVQILAKRVVKAKPAKALQEAANTPTTR